MNWRRFDTLGLRLFVLMWATLVASHFFAYSVVVPLLGRDGPRAATGPQPPRGDGGTGRPAGGPQDRAGGMDGPAGGPPPGAPGHAPGGRPAGPPGPGPGPGPGPAAGPGPGGLRGAALPPLGTLPPGGLVTNSPGPGGGLQRPPADANRPGGAARGLPASLLWLDYAVRAAIIALMAALGARWVSGPMRRLVAASRDLSQGLARGRAPQVLDERRGTVEVREMAHVFNDMARRLQEQFDARGMHLASVSHDLRTPLTRLRMRLEDAEPQLAAGASADIHEMSEMIDATLEVLREQREGSQARVVDVRALLEAIVDDLATTGHDAALETDVDAQALARPAALRRVVGNLVGNALRYGGQARLGLALVPDGVEVTVDDRGPGIPPDMLELAFRPWVRLTTTHARSGHGLGLAIARDLAERDGGRLTLANRPEGGLRARLVLPAAR